MLIYNRGIHPLWETQKAENKPVKSYNKNQDSEKRVEKVASQDDVFLSKLFFIFFSKIYLNFSNSHVIRFLSGNSEYLPIKHKIPTILTEVQQQPKYVISLIFQNKIKIYFPNKCFIIFLVILKWTNARKTFRNESIFLITFSVQNYN